MSLKEKLLVEQILHGDKKAAHTLWDIWSPKISAFTCKVTSLSLFLVTVMAGTDFTILYVRTSLLFVTVSLLIPTIWPFGIMKTISYYKAVFKKEKQSTDREGIRYFKSINTYLLTVSLFAFFLSTIATLTLIHDPEIYGPNLATTLTIPLYSAYLSVSVFLPFRFILEQKTTEAD